jgi:hypothetical protein
MLNGLAVENVAASAQLATTLRARKVKLGG